MDTGILIVRALFGLAMAAHGAQKLFGWFGGYGITKTGSSFEALGFRPGVPFAVAAGLSEFVGGLLMAIGLLTPFGSAAVLSAMLVAIMSVHAKNGFFAAGNGIELPFLYAVVALAVAWTGAGSFSVDGLLGLVFAPYVVIGSLAFATLGAMITLGVRHGETSTKTEVRGLAAKQN